MMRAVVEYVHCDLFACCFCAYLGTDGFLFFLRHVLCASALKVVVGF